MSSEWIEKNAENLSLGDQICVKDVWKTVTAIHDGSDRSPSDCSVWVLAGDVEIELRRGTKVMVRPREQAAA